MPSITTPRILWAAILMSQAMYSAMIVGHVFEAPSEPPDFTIFYALAAVAVAVAVASFAVPAMIRKRAVAAAVKDLAHGEASASVVRRRAYQVGFSPFILGIALSEAVAIYGLVLSVLGFSEVIGLGFIGAGTMLTLVRFPTDRTFVGPFEEALGRSIV